MVANNSTNNNIINVKTTMYSDNLNNYGNNTLIPNETYFTKPTSNTLTHK